MFLAGHDDSIDAMASRLGVRRDYLAVLVRLSYLSPEIVRAILVGQQPVELTPTRLVMLSRNLPHDWQEQRRLLLAGIPHVGRERAVRRSALEPHNDATLDEVRKLVGIPVCHANAAMRGALVDLRGIGCAVQAVARLG